MTFHSIVCDWCKRYKYMLHTKENKRFFLTDSQMGVVDFAKDIANAFSPCVVMESAVEGGGPINRPSRNYPIYFMVRAEKMADGDDAAVAKEEAWLHAQNFLTWLTTMRENELNEDKRDGDFARINLDDYIDIQSIGPLENGWFGVMIQFEREEPLNLCIDEDLYPYGKSYGEFADEYFRQLEERAEEEDSSN